MYNYQKALIPAPQKITDGGRWICLGTAGKPACTLVYASNGNPVFASAVKLMNQTLGELSGGEYPIELVVDLSVGHKEGYILQITDRGAQIRGADAAGVFYGAVTFEKLLRKQDGSAWLPVTEILDYPDFKERGQFLEDRYGSEFMTLEDYKEAIDYFAKMKINSLTIGVYGCWAVQYDNRRSEYLYIPFEKYPQLKTVMHIKYYSPSKQDYVMREKVLPTMFQEPFFGEVIRYAAEKNITVRPLFNSYGHNTLIPREIPEISAKDEQGNPRGIGLCTANEKTYEVLFDIYDEIIDKYLTPNGIDSFHIGLDEVPITELCKCEKCREHTSFELAIEHVIKLIRHLKEKGMRHVHMYYDTVFGFFRTTAGTYSNLEGAPSTQEEVDAYVEKTAQRFREEGIYDVTVLDWWSYSRNERLFYARDLNSSFRSVIKPMTGYYHWLAPMERNDSIKGCAQRAVKYGFEGIEAYSSLEYSYDRPYQYMAAVAWNKNLIPDQQGFYDSYAYQLCPEAPELTAKAMEILGDLSEDDRKPNLIGKLGYYWTSYKKKDLPYPRCYFDDLKANIDKDPEKFLAFFADTKQRAGEAWELLNKAPIADTTVKKALMASAKHFQIQADCYDRLYAILSGKEENREEQLQYVIGKYEELIAVAEDARREYTLYHYARDLSIQRELCINALAKIRENSALSLPETEKMGSSMLSLLR